MDITHLVVNGCSWTYCQGLEDPKNQGWPKLLADQLGCEVVNLAIPGSGNDTVHRRVYEYVHENLPTNSKPLFVIMWSQYWRREHWWRKWYNADCDDFAPLHYPDGLPTNDFEKAFIKNFNEEEFIRKMMIIKTSLVALFNCYNIPYVMFDYHDDHTLNKTIEDVKKRFPNFYKTFSQINDVESVNDVTRYYSKTPCGHDGLDAHPVLSNFLKGIIDKKYGPLNVVSSDFLRAKDFPIGNKNNYTHFTKSVWM
jgi:hypothetical protein